MIFSKKMNWRLSLIHNDVWVDTDITLRDKDKAKKQRKEDPIKRLMLLKVANNKPEVVKNDDTLDKAITLMMMKNFSQLPGVTGSTTICGYISWQTIGEAKSRGVNSVMVKDYKSDNVILMKQETPLLDAITSVYDNNFIVVIGKDKKLCGIVTVTDISSQFISWTKPFVLLEEIENHLRYILNDKLLLEDVKATCQTTGRDINTLDDLTLGECQNLFEDEYKWEKFGLAIDKKHFTQTINEIREIRNCVMHFDPEGLTEEQISLLSNFVSFLNKVSPFEKKI